MGTLAKQVYDPHLLYHAINITVELEYKVPMQKIYDILELVEKLNEKNVDKISTQEILSLLKTLGNNLESSVLTDAPPEGNNTNLQAKIKELLRLLGCVLSDRELNKILKGELSLDDALSKQAKLAWLMIFEKDGEGKYRPCKEMVDHMLWCSQTIAIENVELRIQRLMENHQRSKKEQLERPQLQNNWLKNKNTHMVFEKVAKDRDDPVVLEKKRNKLRLYIAHMQGYDKDRDRDGGRGVDMTTGIVIDFGDIYIADKSHGNIIEDREHDGIDIRDIH